MTGSQELEGVGGSFRAGGRDRFIYQSGTVKVAV